MAEYVILPRISTADENFHNDYKTYLGSDWWKRRRNQALARAGWRCEHCRRKAQALQVHHLSYEHLGAERDEDLQVLCEPCHADAHLDALEGNSDTRIYLKLGREVLKNSPFGSSIGVLTEALKQLCADRRIPYRGPELYRALDVLVGTKVSRTVELRHLPDEPAQTDDRPLSHADAYHWLYRIYKTLGVPGIGVTPMASEPTAAERQAEEDRIREQARALRVEAAATERKKPPRSIEARIDAIFRGEE